MTISLATREEISIANAAQVSPERLIYADMLRAWAILQVIYVHCTSTYFGNLKATSPFWACFFPEVFGRASVPLFLMLSGMFLLQKEISSPMAFLRKRMGRILIPLAVWSALYLLWGHFFKGREVDIQRCFALLGAPAYYHLGYLYFLTGLYLSTPLLKVFTKAATRKDYWYFISLWVLGVSFLPAFQKITGISCLIQIAVATNLSGYFVIGYALRDYFVPKSTLPALWLAAIISYFACCAVTYFATAANNGNFDAFFVESSSALIFIYSVATFLIFKSINFGSWEKSHPVLLKIGKSIGDYAFTMYLLHPIILDVCIRFKLFSFIHKTGFGWTTAKILLLTTVVVSMTWIVVRLGRLIKAPRWLFP